MTILNRINSIFLPRKKFNQKNLNIILNTVFQKIPRDYRFFLENSNGGYTEAFNNEFNLKVGLLFKIKYADPEVVKFRKSLDSGIIQFFGTSENEYDHSNIIYANRILYQDWYYEDNEVEFAKKLIPFAEDNTNFYCIDTNRNNEIRYFDMSYNYHDNIKEYEPLAPTFTSFIKLLIDQNGGYIQNLSEIYEEMVKNGFK